MRSFVFVFLAAVLPTAAAEIRVTPAAISVEPAEAGRLLVYVEGQTEPILGRQQGHVFAPRFPFNPGVAYRAVFTPAKGAPVVHRFTLPKTVTPPTRMVELYPTAGTLPENQLKFYLHFSAPMSRGEAYRHIHLKDDRGADVALPFLELDEELWDREARRLTLFFDPGRIKRGLVPHNEAGVPLVAGHRYTLLVDAAWPDATGQPLAAPFTRTFTVTPADRTAPTLSTWKLTKPTAGTRQPLMLDFPEPLDRALLGHMIRVKGLDGEVTVERQEMRWLFTPRDPWATGDYVIEVDAVLEDLAGNKLNRLFDVDVFEKVDRQVTPEVLTLRFTL